MDARRQGMRQNLATLRDELYEDSEYHMINKNQSITLWITKMSLNSLIQESYITYWNPCIYKNISEADEI